jgi:hypothetical protein
LAVTFAPTTHPENRLAAQKTASGFFCDFATDARPVTLPQTLETYQESGTRIYETASGFAVHLFNAELSNATEKAGKRLIIVNGSARSGGPGIASGEDMLGAANATKELASKDTIVINAGSIEDALTQIEKMNIAKGSISDISFVDHGAVTDIFNPESAVQYYNKNELTVDLIKSFVPLLTDYATITFYGCDVGSNLEYMEKISNAFPGKTVYAFKYLYGYPYIIQNKYGTTIKVYEPLKKSSASAGFESSFVNP